MFPANTEFLYSSYVLRGVVAPGDLVYLLLSGQLCQVALDFGHFPLPMGVRPREPTLVCSLASLAILPLSMSIFALHARLDAAGTLSGLS